MAYWVVTGGAGFIGSHIVETLLHKGEKVKVIDNFSTGKRENLRFPQSSMKGELEIVEADIRDLDILRKEFKGVDYVLHQAALRSVPKSFHNPSEYNHVNVTGTLNVLMAARECDVKRVVYASSSSVYGEREQLPAKETDLPDPISIYAATKLNGEYYCRVFTQLYNLETVVLRYFNVYGPRQSLENQYAVVIPKFIVCFMKGENPPIYGDGFQSRDFTYIDNVVKANILAALKPEASGKIFNIANGRAYTVLELYEFIKNYFGSDLEPKFEPPRPGDVRHTLADISRARAVLGYTPEIDFEQGLLLTIKWFQDNFNLEEE